MVPRLSQCYNVRIMDMTPLHHGDDVNAGSALEGLACRVVALHCRVAAEEPLRPLEDEDVSSLVGATPGLDEGDRVILGWLRRMSGFFR